MRLHKGLMSFCSPQFHVRENLSITVLRIRLQDYELRDLLRLGVLTVSKFIKSPTVTQADLSPSVSCGLRLPTTAWHIFYAHLASVEDRSTPRWEAAWYKLDASPPLVESACWILEMTVSRDPLQLISDPQPIWTVGGACHFNQRPCSRDFPWSQSAMDECACSFRHSWHLTVILTVTF